MHIIQTQRVYAINRIGSFSCCEAKFVYKCVFVSPQKSQMSSTIGWNWAEYLQQNWLYMYANPYGLHGDVHTQFDKGDNGVQVESIYLIQMPAAGQLHSYREWEKEREKPDNVSH